MFIEFSECDEKWKILLKKSNYLVAKGSYLDDDYYFVITFYRDEFYGEPTLFFVPESDFEEEEDFLTFVEENKEDLEDAIHDIAEDVMYGDTNYEKDEKGRITQALLFQDELDEDTILFLLYKHHKKRLKVFELEQDDLLEFYETADFPITQQLQETKYETERKKQCQTILMAYILWNATR